MSTHSLKINQENHHKRLDIFLAENLDCVPSRSFAKKLIDHGHVRVNEIKAKAHYKVIEGEDIVVEIPKDFLSNKYIAPEDIPLNIFYEDDYLIVVNKANGMIVHPANGNYSNTLVNALLHYSNQLSSVNDDDIRPGIIHRLDKETSGLILVAKDNITHTRIAKQFQRHEVKKCYIALVEGEVTFDEGKIDAPIGKHRSAHEKKAISYGTDSKEALTHYRVIKSLDGATLVALFPKTGRTHQLRLHMKHIGHVILGDDKYGRKSTFTRLALHAQSIGFTHPIYKNYIEFSSIIPKEFLSRVGL
ncbi:MAG: RluA family pseudouridine synthase [Candidatus Zapsychrus exili]|nr:RluA family pseudouridine synthase [Candidatus Zapsychrus exili]